MLLCGIAIPVHGITFLDESSKRLAECRWGKKSAH